MNGQIWFIVFFYLASFVSLKGIHASPFNGQHTANWDSVQGIGDVSVYPDEAIEATLSEMRAALSQMREKLESVEERLDALEKPANFTREPASGKPCKFDFEDGIDGWERTGTVFNNQPTYGDNPTARNRGQPANQQGDWWIGGAEDCPSKEATPGKTQWDKPQGTLTSPLFNISGRYISFLIGGGCNIQTVRAELIIADRVVRKATGKCTETMAPRIWDVGEFTGYSARVRLIDFSSGGWGHINFDDLRGDITCGQI